MQLNINQAFETTCQPTNVTDLFQKQFLLHNSYDKLQYFLYRTWKQSYQRSAMNYVSYSCSNKVSSSKIHPSKMIQLQTLHLLHPLQQELSKNLELLMKRRIAVMTVPHVVLEMDPQDQDLGEGSEDLAKAEVIRSPLPPPPEVTTAANPPNKILHYFFPKNWRAWKKICKIR